MTAVCLRCKVNVSGQLNGHDQIIGQNNKKYEYYAFNDMYESI